MSKSDKSRVFGDSEIENARIGYQGAIELVNDLDAAIWSIFNAMLVAHSIVAIAGIGLFSAPMPALPLEITSILSFIGLILCVVWFLMIKRYRDFRVYYIMSARELEEKYLGQTVKTFSRGGAFAKGESVTLEIGKEKFVTRLSFWSRVANVERTSFVVIFVFTFVYLSLLFLSNTISRFLGGIHMTIHVLTYICLGIAAIIYAFILNSQKGKKFAKEHTWASVVVGNSMILVALWFLIPQNYWLNVALAFIVSGVPLIARSLLNKM